MSVRRHPFAGRPNAIRDQWIGYLRKMGFTYDAIGEHFGISGARAREVYERLLRCEERLTFERLLRLRAS